MPKISFILFHLKLFQPLKMTTDMRAITLKSKAFYSLIKLSNDKKSLTIFWVNALPEKIQPEI